MMFAHICLLSTYKSACPWLLMDTFYWTYTMPGSARTCTSHGLPPADRKHRVHIVKAIVYTELVINRSKCQRVECDKEYIGEPARTFAERFKEQP